MKDPYVLEDGTLKNLLGITDYEELKKAEKDIGFIRLTNIDIAFSNKFNKELLQDIHKHIFEDIFSWAGEFRKVPIYKEEVVIPGLSLEYCNYKKIPQELDKCLTEFNRVNWDSLDLDAKIQTFTELLARLWRIHPFRDGNTRTTMVFASLFAKEHDFPLDFDIILDNLTRQIGDNGKITRYSIRDKFVLAALDKKDYPEPEHLQSLLKHSIVSGISKKVERLSSQLKSTNEEGER